MVMVLHNDENKITYSLFKDEKELKRHIWCWINELELEDYLKETLLKLGQLSRKFLGLSFKRQNELAKDLDVCKRTVQRRIDALEELGVIKQIPTCDRKGQQMQNFIQLQPFPKINEIDAMKKGDKQEENVMSSPVSPQMSFHTNISLSVISSSTNFLNDRENEYFKTVTEEKLVLPSYVPEEFIKLMTPGFRDNHKMIYKLWGKVKMAARMAHFRLDIINHIEHIVNLFHQAKTLGIHLNNLRKGNSMDAVIGYWFSSVKKYLTDAQKVDENFWSFHRFLIQLKQTRQPLYIKKLKALFLL
jgi:DNA-binding GntR family transcriptional regulator